VTGLALGVDVGTTGVKASLVDPDGRIQASASSHHGILSRGGLVEADPQEWWRSVLRALRELGDALARVVTVGVSGNMSSVVLLDERGGPVSDAPLLADTRGREQIAALSDELARRIERLTFNQPATVFSLSTLLWLRDVQPELLTRVSAWVSAKDYVRLRLTGEIATDLTDAYNSLLIGAGADGWDTSLVADLGLPATILPTLRGSAERAGEVTASAAKETGLPAGTPVITGAGDMAAAVIGAGALDPGTLLVSLGTSITAMLSVKRPDDLFAWKGAMTYHPLPGNQRGFALASLLTGGLAVNWLRDELGLDPAAATEPPSVDDPLVFLPHLAGTGTPDFDPLVCGSLLGVRASTTRADILAALYEALAFELADIVELVGLEPGARVILTGGGTRLPNWTQGIVDALQRPVEVTTEPDISALGAARLALDGIEAGAWTVSARPGRHLQPGASRRVRHARYRAARAAAAAYYDSTSERRDP
jgi:xylulokinase